jgi:hypothetical protein
MRASLRGRGAGLVLVALLAPAALAQEAELQLRLDHAVAESDHVVRGQYRSGTLAVKEELKGRLAERGVHLDRDDVEPREADLVPGTPRLASGEGVFFLVARFDGKGEDARSFIEWQGAEGVAWEGTQGFLRYLETDDGRLAIAEVSSRATFERLLAASVAKERALEAALAVVDTSARARSLAELVASAHDAPREVEAALGPDPFAQRALVEIGHAGAASLLDEIRAKTTLPWVKPACVRALALVPESVGRLEALAASAAASEDEVVAAIDMLFATDDASATATLVALSVDPRARVRRATAAALREKVKDLDALERLMKDPDVSVRDAARDSARAAARRLGLELPE